MRIVDANVLLYAVNADTEHHDASRDWLDHSLAGADRVGFTWVALLAFLRLATKPGLFPNPLTLTEAHSQVGDWLTAPGGQQVAPGRAHLSILERLLAGAGTGGNLVNDAHFAAVAVEHRASIVSYDNDFSRFPGVSWARPDRLLS